MTEYDEYEEMYETCCVCAKPVRPRGHESPSKHAWKLGAEPPLVPRCEDCWCLQDHNSLLKTRPIPLSEWFEEDRPGWMLK